MSYRGRVQVNGCLNRGAFKLRKSANMSADSWFEIADGTELEVTLTSGKNWFKTTYNNKTGYIRTDYVAITEGYPLHRVNVSSGTLSIRATPSTSANAYFTAAKDRGLYVLETSGDWSFVSCNIGSGWAKSSYLVPDSSAVPFDYPTVEEFIERLKGFCGKGWTYGAGYSSTGKYIDCSNYPYVSRYSLGEKGATSEYNSLSDDQKGMIGDYNDLRIGMEVFQSNPSDSSIKDHMGVYAGYVTFENGETRHAVYQSRATYSANQLALYSERTGPNLTEMNNNWDYYAYSKYVRYDDN